MPRHTRSIAAAITAAGALLASVPAAHAAPSPAAQVARFNAPIFGTTATLTEGRMPTFAEVNCADARCTKGVVIGAEGGVTQYISTTIARGGAFADSPAFVAKLNKTWFGLSGNLSDDRSTFTINLTQVATGADAAALVAADAAKYGGKLSAPAAASGATTWSATGDHGGALWTVSYVALGDALARGACLQYGAERESATCPAANVQALTLSTVLAPAPTELAGVRSVAGLVPARVKGLTPQFLNIEPAKPLWAVNAPTPALERALNARANSVSLQYGVAGQPALLFTAKVGAVSSTAAARPWTATVCEMAGSTSRTCERTALRGPASGFLGVWSMRTPSEGPGFLSVHFTGAGKVGEAECTVPGTLGADRALTADETRACRTALTAFAAAVVR